MATGALLALLALAGPALAAPVDMGLQKAAEHAVPEVHVPAASAVVDDTAPPVSVPDVEQTTASVSVPDVEAAGRSVPVDAAVDRVVTTTDDTVDHVVAPVDTTVDGVTGSVGEVMSQVAPRVEAVRSLDLPSGSSSVAAPESNNGDAPPPTSAAPVHPSAEAPVAVGPPQTVSPHARMNRLAPATAAASGATSRPAFEIALPSLDPFYVARVGSGAVPVAEQVGNLADGTHTPADGPVPATGASASASSFAPLFAAALLALMALMAPRILRSLKEAPAFLRPAPFVALLERPG